MDAPWIAVTVERPGSHLDAGARQRLDEAMKLAQSLGAETQTLTGNDLPAELLRFAKFENVTQIVVGRSRGGFFSELLRRSLPHELVRRDDRTSRSMWSPDASEPHRMAAARFALAESLRDAAAFSLGDAGRRRRRCVVGKVLTS